MLESPVAVCPVCGNVGVLGVGPGGRPRASCRRCGSLERHRALVGVLLALTDACSRGALVDIAPSRVTSDRLAALAVDAGVPYVALDFDPGADNRVVNVQASMTDLPLRDGSVGLLICFHVLEHIPDDAAAMAEMRRVLAPSGVAVVQVPRRTGVPTDEDPAVVSAEERLRRFGQADHVRYYGDDFEERLAATGLKVCMVTMGDLYGELEADLLGIRLDEPLWLCTTDSEIDLEEVQAACASSSHVAVVTALASVHHERDEARLARDRLSRRASMLRQRLRRVRRDRDRAVERESRLRGRPAVRMTSAVARILRPLSRRS